uniref:DOCKER domain-containing protein n=1 Tax=Romanomermis culicivorax TaxID=13658 RepID=A0A915KLC9_ROMCU
LRCHNYKDEDFKDLLRKTPLLVASLFKKQTDSHDEKFKLTLKCLGAALKYFPMVVDELSAVSRLFTYFRVELTEILVNVPQKLMMQGLRFVESLINSNVFVRQECRLLLLPCFLRLLKNCIETGDELDLSASVILGLFDILYGRNSTCKPDNCDVENIVGILLRPIMQLVVRMSDSSPSPNNQDMKLKYVAILIAILDKLTACSYSNYIKRFGHPVDLADFLTEMFMLIKDLVENCRFAPDWFHLIFVQNSVFLKILSFAAETVRLRFADPSRAVQCTVYKDFFQTCVAFIIQKHLQPKMALDKRKLTHKKDLRLACANEIKALWTKMDAFRKSEFIPNLVGPILCVTLISYPELRRSTIPLFLDMIATTLCPSTSSQIKGDTLKNNCAPSEKYLQFEREFISQLDILVDSGYGDEHYADAFINIMNDLLPKHKDNKIRKMGDRLVDIVRRLMRRLLEYRDVKQNHDCIDNRLNCVFNLMEFYKEIEQVELYVRYCYKLYHFHSQAGNFVEAAWTLKLHADLLHRRMAQFYDNIINQKRAEPEHFYVLFCGKDFPAFLQKRSFIYRGQPFERIGDFNNRMVAQYPKATISSKWEEPSDSQSSSQMLYIRKVDPMIDESLLNQFSSRNSNGHVNW